MSSCTVLVIPSFTASMQSAHFDMSFTDIKMYVLCVLIVRLPVLLTPIVRILSECEYFLSPFGFSLLSSHRPTTAKANTV